MIAPYQYKHFWPLLKLLALPVGIVKWMLYACGLLFIIGLGVIYFFDNPVFMIFSLSLLVLYFFLLVFVSPGSMLAMVTSKQFSMLPNLRQSIFLIMAIFILLAASVAPVSFLVKEGASGLMSIGLISLLLTSCVVLGLIYLLSLWSNAYLVIFVPMMGLAPLVQTLVDQPWLVLLLLLVFVWTVFARWWFRWQPKMLFKNNMAQPQAEIMKKGFTNTLNLERKFGLSTKPKNIVNSFLLDGVDSQCIFLMRGLGIVILIATVYFAFKLYWDFDTNTTSPLKKLWASQMVLLVVYGRAGGVILQVFRNAKKIWMLFPVHRSDLFGYIEKLSFRWAAAGLVFPMMAGVAIVVSSPFMFISPLQFFWSFVYGMELGFATFYISLAFYALKGASLPWMTWASGLLVLLVIAFWSAASFYLDDASMQMQLLFSSVGVVGIVVIVCARFWSKRLWQKVNFVGMKT
jgi:hypothetical protein